MPWGTNEQPSSADRKIVELDNVSYTIGSWFDKSKVYYP